MRIDLFISAGCPGCPVARTLIERFAHDHPGVEVHEWDISRDPGPAAGRGIFATPTVLLDGVHILTGVPEAPELERYQNTTASVGMPSKNAERILPPSKRLDASSQ